MLWCHAGKDTARYIFNQIILSDNVWIKPQDPNLKTPYFQLNCISTQDKEIFQDLEKQNYIQYKLKEQLTVPSVIQLEVRL